MSASRLHSTRVARLVTVKVDSSHRKSGRKTLRDIRYMLERVRV